MRPHRLYLSIIFSVLAQPVFADAVLEQAQALLNLKKIVQAYDLLAPLEDARAGQADYDYLYGLTLLEAGEHTRAAFAFERCLGTEPNNGPCRVQMARTHLALGETVSSRKELDTIKQYNPPPEVQSLVDQYLGITKKVEDNKKRQLSNYLKVSAGYDSNINNATENARIALPSFANTPVFLIVPYRESSSFAQLDAGTNFSYQFNPDLVASVEANVLYRSLFDNNNFDYYTLDVSAGALKNMGNVSVQGKLQMQTMALDGQNYRDVLGGLVQIQRPIGENGQIAAFTQLSQLRYDSQQTRDADRTTFGIAYSQALETRFSPSFYASLYQGQEQVTDDQFDYFSQSFTGLRVGGSLAYSQTLALNAHLSLEQRDYDKANQFLPFTGAREDSETGLTLGLTWLFKPKYSLQPFYTYSNNNANHIINDYTRHMFGVDLRIAL